MEKQLHHLDPDYRTQPKNWKLPFCARCQKNLDTSKAYKCNVDFDSHTVFLTEDGKEWIGKDCCKAIGLRP